MASRALVPRPIRGRKIASDSSSASAKKGVVARVSGENPDRYRPSGYDSTADIRTTSYAARRKRTVRSQLERTFDASGTLDLSGTFALSGLELATAWILPTIMTRCILIIIRKLILIIILLIIFIIIIRIRIIPHRGKCLVVAMGLTDDSGVAIHYPTVVQSTTFR